MKKTTVVLMVILLIVAVGLIYFLIPKNKVSETDKLAQACRDHNGTWLATYQECEYADKDWCFSVGGNYNECASACRHNADKTGACTMQCVQVCSFGDQSATTESMGSDAKNSTYIIEGKSVTLEDGYLEQEIAPGSASKTVTQFFGQTPVGDLDGNGLDDMVVMLTQSSGGSGTFYYVAAALDTGNGYSGTNAVFVGDRISPQTVGFNNGEIMVNYADRFPWASYATPPSVGKTKYLTYQNGQLIEKPTEQLSQDTATTLVTENWGSCTPGVCQKMTVTTLDGKDGVWYVQAVYNGMYDDSVQAEKRIAAVHYVNSEWKFGAELVREYKCQPGRGQQEFSSELCI